MTIKKGSTTSSLRMKGRYLAVSSDPITGANSDFASYAVNVSTNDVAATGLKPRFLHVIALFPASLGKSSIEELISDIERKTLHLGVKLAGIRLQTIRGLERPLVVVTAIGSGTEYVSCSGAKAGDAIIVTKTAGIEGTAILSQLPYVKKLVGRSEYRHAKRYVKQIGIAREARLAFETGCVHAMHDTTEGGILGAVYEMSLASNKGFKLFGDKIPLDSTTERICKALGIDPLMLIGSGSLVIASEQSSAKAILEKLQLNGIGCAIVGKFVSLGEGRFLERKKGNVARRITEDSIQEQLWEALRKYGDLS